ncbi:ST7 protein [mine drainage metagenome]|uniref:ST7 protein n=1 Tax=mine drainage metagenome TaxID=410659 RepID=A0A1J5R7W5_9ZZZZ
MPVSRKRKRPASSVAKPKAAPLKLPDRRGMEAFLSQLTGGPAESGLAVAQDVMYEAWDTPDRQRRIALATQALSLSPLCADAYVLLAEEQARTPEEALDLYRRGMEAGEKAIGQKAFTEDAGHFWGILETRPYMRARLGLAMLLRASGARDETIVHLQGMLRLNPGDNQGVRYILLSLLLETGRDDEAKTLLDRYDGDIGASWPWGAVLLSYRREGDGTVTRGLLDSAMKTNGHVPAYLLGRKKLPVRMPEYITPGGEDEAEEYVRDAVTAWTETPGALPWLETAVPAAAKVRKVAPRRPRSSR